MKILEKYYLLHPFLFSLYPLLFLYSNNLGKVEICDIFKPFGIIFFSCLTFFGLFRLFLKSSQKSAVLSSIWIFLFFSFGHVYNAFWFGTQDFYSENYTVIFVLWLILFSLSIFWVVISKNNFLKINKILFSIGITLLFISVFNIILFTAQNVNNKQPHKFSEITLLESKTYIGNDRPDVYYIILDRYAREDVLLNFYNFDNSNFISFLKDKGFFVADKSRANYLKTTHSLSSSLNMNYLNSLKEKYGEKSADWRPLYKMLIDYPVWKIFKENGYSFFHFGTRWQPTSRNPHADENINLHHMPEFEFNLYKTTYLDAIGTHFGVFNDLKIQWERERYKLERLKKIPDLSQPTFVFAHFLIPHIPYVFSRDGEFVESVGNNLQERYLDQTLYINSEMEEIIDIILSKSPNSVIIIQSDEGPHPSFKEADQYTYNWTTASSGDLHKKFGILNAYYFPKKDTSKILYPEITPVNSFRILFDLYFGTDYGLLEDKSYIYQDYKHPYKYIDVTDKFGLEN